MPQPRCARVLVLVGASLLSGCGGGAAKPAGAPSAPPSDESAPPAQGYPQQQPGYGAPSSTAPREEDGDFAQPPAASPPPPVGEEPGSAQPSLEQASLQLDRAAAELSAAGGDCARACKALASMNRAAERICALDPDESAGGRCQRAKARISEATERVRRSCACG